MQRRCNHEAWSKLPLFLSLFLFPHRFNAVYGEANARQARWRNKNLTQSSTSPWKKNGRTGGRDGWRNGRVNIGWLYDSRRAKGTTTKLVIIPPYFFVASKKKTAAATRRCRLGSLGPNRGRSTGHFPIIKRDKDAFFSLTPRARGSKLSYSQNKKGAWEHARRGNSLARFGNPCSIYCECGSILQTLQFYSNIRSYTV